MAATVPMTRSGHCAYPSHDSHRRCQALSLDCTCGCHADPAAYDDTIGYAEESTPADDESEADDIDSLQ